MYGNSDELHYDFLLYKVKIVINLHMYRWKRVLQKLQEHVLIHTGIIE